MRVLFCMLGEPGHHLPTFPLARALRARGHEVVYAAIPDLQRDIEARGFGYVPIHGDVFPLGKSSEIDRLPVQERVELEGVLRKRMAVDKVGGRVERCLRAVDPAIVLVDIIDGGTAFVVHSLGLPCLRLSTSLSQRLDELPPLTTSLPLETPHFELEAARHEACAQVMNRVALNGLAVFIARFAYPPRDVSLATTWVPDLALYPEALLCPAPFDFPRARDLPVYLATSVELDRAEEVPEALERFVDGRSPLLFASLGSQPGRYPHGPSFFRAIIGALRARPEWRLVIAAGEKFFEHECLAEPPSNVLVLRRVPQLWLLRRAAVFLTHAGLGSVREAIALHVPMIVVPQQFDQPGNAARVVYHGIGIHRPADAIDAAGAELDVAAILEDRKGYEERLARLDEACRKSAEDSPAVAIIEAAAGRRPASRVQLRLPDPVDVPRTASGDRLGWLFVDSLGRFGGGPSIAPGALVMSTDERPPELGVSGFTMCPSIGDALSRGVGTFVARVQTAGVVVEDGAYVVARGLRCLWLLDVETELVGYADWCANVLLEGERRSDPVAYEAFQKELQRLRDQIASGAAAESVETARRAFTALATKLLYRGYLPALGMRCAHDQARFSRWGMANQLALLAAGSLAGTAEGAQRFVDEHTRALRRTDAELLARVVGRARAAGIDVGTEPELRPREDCA
jgi:zeaxanthin glucosyltransferase